MSLATQLTVSAIGLLLMVGLTVGALARMQSRKVSSMEWIAMTLFVLAIGANLFPGILLTPDPVTMPIWVISLFLGGGVAALLLQAYEAWYNLRATLPQPEPVSQRPALRIIRGSDGR